MGASDHARRALKVALVEAVTLIGENTLGEAVERAPKDEGTLRGSGDLDVNVTPARVTATVSFDTVYAARQHEETEWHHTTGQAKYLESVVRENAVRYNTILAAAARRALGGLR